MNRNQFATVEFRKGIALTRLNPEKNKEIIMTPEEKLQAFAGILNNNKCKISKK
ncbi:MAG: hypothetical protein ACFFAE_03060 [Candidatus Hodarchaeota archaeon]